jgi:hypothetical protein
LYYIAICTNIGELDVMITVNTVYYVMHERSLIIYFDIISMSDLKYQDWALREDKSNKIRYDLIPLCQLKKLAQHYTDGAVKHWDRNRESGWLKYAEMCKQSAWRHFTSRMNWETDENHDSALVWNIFAYNFLINKNNKQWNETWNQS